MPDGPHLSPPLDLRRVYADGHEEHLRGAAFINVERWALRDIVAAGQQVQGTYLAPFQQGGSSYSPIVGMATWLSAPEVLVEELELVPVSPDPKQRPVIPSPSG